MIDNIVADHLLLSDRCLLRYISILGGLGKNQVTST